MAASKKPAREDYFDVGSTASSSPSSTPGGSQQEWGPSRTQLSSRYQPRRGSTASSIFSIASTAQNAAPRRIEAATTDISQNAISTLLQPPIVRTGLIAHTSAPASTTFRPPGTKEIPPVTLTNIPHVDPSVFKPYLVQVGSLYEARAHREPDEYIPPTPTATGRTEHGQGQDDFSKALEHRLHKEQQQRPGLPLRQGSVAPRSPLDSPQATRRRGSGGRRRLEVTPLSTIPGVYFDENFHLENPRTFDIVSERSEVIRTPVSEEKSANGSANGNALPPRKALATNAILQEKLSWYLDTVEIHLISSISAASKSFFAALGSLKELHCEAADSVARIKKLREDLAVLDKEMAVGGLEIVGMKQRRDNLRKLNDSVDQLRNVVNGASHCEDLVDQGDLDIALDRIAVLEDYACGRLAKSGDLRWLIADTHLQLRDLRRLKALSGFAEGMDQLRARVGKGYENRFMDALLGDLRQHIASVPNQDTAKRWAQASLRARGHASGPSVVPTYLQTNSQLRQNLSVILHGLSRSKSLTIASAAFRDAIMREMKGLIRQHLPSSSDDDIESVASVSTTRSRAVTQQDKSARLARNLRQLGAEDAEELFMKCYCGVGEALRRLQTQVKMLLDVTSAQALSPSSNGPRSPVRNPNLANIDAQIKTRPRSDSTPLQEELMQALDLSSLLGQAVDAAQTQVTKILKVRTEQSISLDLTHFLRYFTLNRLFADECENVSGRSGASLKNVVNTHITEFISVMARNEREGLERTMDSDQWAAREFLPVDETVLAQVLEGMSSDPKVWLERAHVWETNAVARLNGAQMNGNGNGNGNGAATTGAKEQAKPAVIEEEKFMLVTSVTTLLHGVSRYQTLVACIPSIAADVSRELIEYLRFFNSRSCQLVLGAGATRSTAALPNINTKHLALASQALSFVIALIPYIREFTRRRPGMSADKLGEFDKVKRLYQDHQVSINEKLVEIMGGRAARHVKAMNVVDWDGEGRMGVGVGKYMETLVKETVVLQRTLGRYLPAHHVRGIMAPVFGEYRELWGGAFRMAQVATVAGKERLCRDAEYFEKKLGAIDGAGDTGAYLVGLAREKNVADPVPAPAPIVNSAPAPAPVSASTAPQTPLPAQEPEPIANANTVSSTEVPASTADRKGPENPVKGDSASKHEERSAGDNAEE